MSTFEAGKEDSASDRVGDWMQVFSGGKFYPLDPRPSEVHLVDIANALARICRFGGHCVLPHYSVAQHSVIVASLVPTGFRRVALLHDAAEAYVGDVIRPIKRSADFAPAFAAVERQVARAIGARFDINLVERAKKRPHGLRRRRPRRLDSPGAAPDQLSWVHSQICKIRRVETQPGYFLYKTKWQAGCNGKIEACHEGEKKPGVGMRSSDTKAFAMCRMHHRQWTGQIGHQGHFEGWSVEQRREWADARGAETEARYLSSGSRRTS